VAVGPTYRWNSDGKGCIRRPGEPSPPLHPARTLKKKKIQNCPSDFRRRRLEYPSEFLKKKFKKIGNLQPTQITIYTKPTFYNHHTWYMNQTRWPLHVVTLIQLNQYKYSFPHKRIDIQPNSKSNHHTWLLSFNITITKCYKIQMIVAQTNTNHCTQYT